VQGEVAQQAVSPGDEATTRSWWISLTLAGLLTCVMLTTFIHPYLFRRRRAQTVALVPLLLYPAYSAWPRSCCRLQCGRRFAKPGRRAVLRTHQTNRLRIWCCFWRFGWRCLLSCFPSLPTRRPATFCHRVQQRRFWPHGGSTSVSYPTTRSSGETSNGLASSSIIRTTLLAAVSPSIIIAWRRR
jgi:hypothetical protein